MTIAQRLSPIPVDDYLDGEQRSRIKHEYVAGMVYAMVGGRYAHNLIASNHPASGNPCRVAIGQCVCRGDFCCGNRIAVTPETTLLMRLV